MRRAPTLVVVGGVVLVLALAPAVGRAGIWVTLASGLAGSSSPSAGTEFWFDTPHGPPPVAINQLGGGVTAEAGTGGGTTFFSGAATPLMLNLSDGSAYIAGGPAPDSAKVPGGSRGGSGASAAPLTGGTIPSGAALLGITVSDPDATGKTTLTAAATDSTGANLGSGTIDVPGGGYWVIGLAPGDKSGTGGGTGGGTDGGNTGGNTGGDPGPPAPPPPPPPSPPPTNNPPPAGEGGGSSGGPTTPEPSTAVLLGLGAGLAGMWSARLRRRPAMV